MDEGLISPQKSIWPFISSLWCIKYYGFESLTDNSIHEIQQSTTSHLAWQQWAIIGVDKTGMIVRTIPDDFSELIALNITFRVVRVKTKGGVIITDPKDIMTYFIPEYNEMLEEERYRRYGHTMI